MVDGGGGIWEEAASGDAVGVVVGGGVAARGERSGRGGWG